MARSTAPVLSFRKRDFVHDLPPSVDLKTPRSGFDPYGSPNAATKTMSGFVGWIRIRAAARLLSRPHPGVDCFRWRLGHRARADRRRRKGLVRDRSPGDAPVGRLPQ